MRTEQADDLSPLVDPVGAPTDRGNDAPLDDAAAPGGVAGGGVAGLGEELGARWQALQVGFVDAPRRAVEDADQLIAEITDQLLEQFRQQRAELERTWRSDEQASTEDLRLALQGYRTFFDRLRAA